MSTGRNDSTSGLGADIDRIFLAVQERRNKPPLPVMPGTIVPRYFLSAHVDAELRKYAANKANVKDGQVLIKNTLAAPITHGVAPALEGLKEISLQHAIKYVNSIQTGCVLFVKTWKEAHRLVATPLCVEDSNGDAIMLNLYNYVRPEEDPQLIFPCGTYLAIMEPYLRFALDDPKQAAMIRSDNPQNIVVFDDERAWNAARGKKTAATTTLSTEAVAARVEAYCEQGNKHFSQKRFRLALKAYSAGLLLDPFNVRILSNRSQTFLSMSSWQQALEDADAVLALELSHTKCRFRRCVSLLCLQRPNDALLELDSILSDLNADDALGAAATTSAATATVKYREEVTALRREALRAVVEQRGEYDIPALLREARCNGPEQPEAPLSRKHMDYLSPHVLLQHVQGKGRGMFATADFAPGTLLCVAKALVFAPYSNDSQGISVDADSSHVSMGSKMVMLPFAVQELVRHPESGRELYSLTAGSLFPAPVAEADYSRVDVARIRAILTSNWFATNTDSVGNLVYAHRQAGLKGLTGTHRDETKKGTGLWVRPSFFNHSCMPNCVYMIIGDFHFTIARLPITAGEELTVPYCGVREPYQARADTFRSWNSGDGFVCQCERCAYIRAHPAVLALETDVEAAYANACALCMQGKTMTEAARIALPQARRRALRAQLEALPKLAQGSLCKLLEMSSMSATTSKDACRDAQQLIALEIALFGAGSSNVELLKARLRLVTLQLVQGDPVKAAATMKEAYASQCRSSWSALSKVDFLVLCERYCGIFGESQALITAMVDAAAQQ